MVTFKAEIEKFKEMGEKSGWTYVLIPQEIANEIKSCFKKSFRVKGKLDHVDVSGLALVPMGEGDFILALKSSLRKQLKKEKGAVLELALEEDATFKIEMPFEVEICLEEEPHLIRNFLSIPKSHQNYYINWFNAAKTEKTRIKRLTMMVNAMDHQLDFGEMIRANKIKDGV